MISNSYQLYKTIKFNRKSNKITTKLLNLEFYPTYILGLKDTKRNLDFLIVGNSSKLSELGISSKCNLSYILCDPENLLDSRERLCVPKKFKDLILKPGDELVALFKYSNHLKLYNEKNAKHLL